MQDVFTGKTTCIKGRALLGAEERDRLQDAHERRLEALGHLGAAAEECGLRTDSDRDLILLAEDEVSLLEVAGGAWAELGDAIRELRTVLPLLRLEDFGFHAEMEHPLEEPNPRLRYLHSGVEASAFISVECGSVYKFFIPREEKLIGSVFGFRRGDEASLLAEAEQGDYRGLLEKLLLVHALGGMATEVVAVTHEGILVAKQSLGEPLTQGADTSGSLPAPLIEIPSRFMRANRDHPRLFFHGGDPWLVADLHARNFVRDGSGTLRVIDLVAAPWPSDHDAHDGLMFDWLERVRSDPTSGGLPSSHDDEL
ncbi:MAG: hypothetical protein V4773_07895 [Verrucomicrobiota bacterium]